jgi:methanogenic corrinoid protein MtbC1
MTEDFEHQFVAGFLAGHADELASTAASRLLERFPDTEARYRPLPHHKWRENLSARVGDLAACVAAESPNLFAAQIAWSRAAFVARDVPQEDLARSLRVLEETVEAQLPPEDAGVVGPFFRAAESALVAPSSPESTTINAGTPEGRLGARYLLAILSGDRLAASDAVLAAAHDGLPVRRIYTHVLLPVQQELGRLWHACEINVAEEHFATATTAMVMAQLQPLSPRTPRNGRCFLAACVEGDMHDLGIRMLADFFEMDGWRVVALGASVPSPDIAAAAEYFDANLVALSATLPVHLDRLRDAVRLLHARESLPVIVGGNVFRADPSLWRSVGADGYAASAEEALRLADTLVPPGRA